MLGVFSHAPANNLALTPRMSRASRFVMIPQTIRPVGSVCLLGSLLSHQFSGISAQECQRDNLLDEICLGPSIVFSRVWIIRRLVRGQHMFEVFVLAGRVGMVAEVIAKRQGTSFFGATSLDQVNVMAVRPLGWSMEERTERV